MVVCAFPLSMGDCLISLVNMHYILEYMSLFQLYWKGSVYMRERGETGEGEACQVVRYKPMGVRMSADITLACP